MQIPQGVLKALTLLNNAGFEAYVVGGCVRDHVLKIQPNDYDICTSATPSEMQQVFFSFRTIETGLRHGTLTVMMEGEPLEITTFRQDGEYLDNRHPKEVTFTRNLENDLSRRDFTVNAMAYHPERGVVDLFGGQEDCKNKIIRCVGNANTRFEEDALRILRALRFAGRLQFSIEEETKKAIFAKMHLLHRISAERIAAELSGLLLSSGAQEILQEFAPVLFTVLWQLNTKEYPFSLQVLAHSEKTQPLRFAALLFPLGAENAKAALQQLKLPNRLQEDVFSLIHFQSLPLSEENMLYALSQTGDALIFPLLSYQRAFSAAKDGQNASLYAEREKQLSEKARQLIASDACYTLSRLAVKGSDLASLGIKGPAIGKTLQNLLEQVAKGKIENKKEVLLSFVQAMNP